MFLITQAPLTLLGTLSTAGHWVQSKIVKRLRQSPPPDKVLQALFQAVGAPKVSIVRTDACSLLSTALVRMREIAPAEVKEQC